jgi:D-proline reductase (dithiol) PrdB
VSLIARYLEARGIPTLCVGSALDILQAGQPPRSVFVDYPLGHSTGKAFDEDDQRKIVRAALKHFNEASTPGDIARIKVRWSTDESWRVQAVPADGDSREPRHTRPMYQYEADRLLAETRQT